MSTIAFAAIFCMFGCGRAASPADSIALGQTHACADGGTWDGLECAMPHVQAEDAPIDHPPVTKRSPRKPSTALPAPQMGECDCEPADPLCTCLE